MSHFFTIAIIPADCENPEAEVERLLAPFDENMDADPHEEECYCVRDTLRDRRFKMLNDSEGDVDRMRGQHHVFRTGLSLKDDQFRADQYDEADAKVSQEVWQARWALREKVEAALLARVGTNMKADPECEECGGTGKRQSTYNPNSKWDWWSYGGRWNGTIRGAYRGDQDTIESITGRPGVGFNFGDEYRQFGENVINVSDYCALLENPETREDVRSFAVLTPDGQWLEKGSMGWWGMVANESDADDWIDCLISTFDQYRDGYVAVGLDLHI